MPEGPFGHLQMAEVFLKQGKLDEAVQEFRESLRIDPDASPEVRRKFGLALAKKGLQEQAIAQFQIALRTQRTDAACWYSLGLCFEAVGRCAEALAAFDNFIANATPDQHAQIKDVIGRIPALRRKLEEGEAGPAGAAAPSAPLDPRSAARSFDAIMAQVRERHTKSGPEPEKERPQVVIPVHEKKPSAHARAIPPHILFLGGLASVIVFAGAALSVSILMKSPQSKDSESRGTRAASFNLPAVPVGFSGPESRAPARKQGESALDFLLSPPAPKARPAAKERAQAQKRPSELRRPAQIELPPEDPLPAKSAPRVKAPPAKSARPVKTAPPVKAAPVPEMVLIPAGEFWMGSPEGEGESDERPRHRVRLDAFFMDTSEATTAGYGKCVREGKCSQPKTGGYCNWGERGRGRHPVNCVDWEQAKAYCAWAGKRLPTEAEWEKAARGGGGAKYGFGDDERELDAYAWYDDNSGGRTHPVREKMPNPYGLYDMHGNVWEWTADWYDSQYYKQSPERSPENQAAAQFRAARGGAWDYYADNLRSAGREAYVPGSALPNVGLRCARSAPPSSGKENNRPSRTALPSAPPKSGQPGKDIIQP
ncbi:MAG: SUMF1/EgtB/PvdO family nonheme iron enzyme [Elusimicrobia bacterium]|nr:SUMF1/EgtB/PvdO family nonheme iron enzyme [Elusimicrobiota bacterium]